jgi:hypothetical protein
VAYEVGRGEDDALDVEGEPHAERRADGRQREGLPLLEAATLVQPLKVCHTCHVADFESTGWHWMLTCQAA